ncbi:acyl-CoA-binding domain-containing protein 5 isoform X2 [Chrysoperla carnea]|uniref:acyl-CoA-binding domain-containing protein 5 isoform X2 n=1 Tax=Chrysoperla carnea TaxID=189513 RepID=UPI001D062E05|nr:acyl-CoA-binding domain-containing protein 5 isoform X2 [Chrysoperla carnea]
MTTEDKFNAAVNVIRSLPKNGSYQPSNELMLRFYAYYKQATEGPCSEAGSKPAFWDVIGRAKHTAWARLKNMPREEAMQRYVDELHSIVETMSYTDNAGDQEILDQLPMDDLELIAGDCLKYVRSQPGSPLASRPSTPVPRENGVSRSPSPTPNNESSTAQPESDDEEFIDTMENDPETIKNDTEIPSKPLVNGVAPGTKIIEYPALAVIANPQQTTIPNGVINNCDINKSDHTKLKYTSIDISSEIARTIAALQTDVRALDSRITQLEQAATANAQKSSKSTSVSATPRQKITIYHLSPTLLAFILIWPFVAIRLSNRFLSSRNK